MPNGFFEQDLQKSVCNKKSKYHHRILHIQSSQGTKFQLKLTILNLDQINPKRIYFQSKKENNNYHHQILRIPINI